MKIDFLPAETEHIRSLLPRLREKDNDEIRSAGLTPRKGLWRSYRQSVISGVMMVDGEIAAAYGCGGALLSDIGYPWLLTSRVVEKAPIAFIKHGHQTVARWITLFPRLIGYVPVSYKEACGALIIWGFKLSGPLTLPNGAGFRQFEMER